MSTSECALRCKVLFNWCSNMFIYGQNRFFQVIPEISVWKMQYLRIDIEPDLCGTGAK